MTLEQLLGYNSAQLKAMSTKELEDFFAPVLHVTRPEYAARIPKKDGVSSSVKSKQFEINQMMKQMGIDIEL